MLPFLENVTRGRGVPRERLARGGAPLRPVRRCQPDQRPEPRADRGASSGSLPSTGSTCRSTSATATGTRSSPTRCGRCATTAVRKALAFFTSPFSSYSGCRQYRENIFEAQQRGRARRAGGGEAAPVPQPSRAGRGERRSPACRARRASGRVARRGGRRVHGAQHPGRDGEELRVRGAAARDRAARRRGGGSRPTSPVVYQSRSGSPQVPWLEPDVGDHLRALAARGVARGRRRAARVRLRPPRGSVRPRPRGDARSPTSSAS